MVLFFRADLLRIARATLALLRRPRNPWSAEARLGAMILAGIVPIGALGLAFKDQIETGARDLRLIGVTLIVLGLVLLWAERVGRRERGVEDLTIGQGLLIGAAQAAALIPGVSRSGATISAGLFLGLDRVAAARFSFLLSVPAVVLSGLFELKGIVDGSTAGPRPELWATALATVTAFAVGYASIAFLLRYLAAHSTAVFIAYRIMLGSLVLVLVAAGAL